MPKTSTTGRPKGWKVGCGMRYDEFRNKKFNKGTKFNSKNKDIQRRKNLANSRISTAISTNPSISKDKILLLDGVYNGNANTANILKKNHNIPISNFIIPNNDEQHFEKLKETEFGDIVYKGDARDYFNKYITFYYLDYCSTFSNMTSNKTPKHDIEKMFKQSLFKEGCWLLFHLTHRNGKWTKKNKIIKHIKNIANKNNVGLKPGPEISVDDEKFLYFSFILHNYIIINYKFIQLY